MTPEKKPEYDHIQGTKFLWQFKKPDLDIIREISTTHNISLPVAHTLFSRGYTDHEKIRSFLFTSFEQDVSPGHILKGAELATQRIIQAIHNKEKILIFGDYDVDGVTSTSVMLLSLLPLGANINYFLPHRKRDGYGLSSKIVKKAAENEYTLLITVDNGIAAHEAANDARALGIDLIITDHHQPHGELPPALSIVNPHQHDCPYPFKYFAGVGVIFKLMAMIYEQLNKQLPDKIYELLLLGTVADVVPLTGENRYWVRHGLQKINKQQSFALSVLAQNSNLTKEIFSSLDIGFMITPQINALGRLDDPREAVKFLISSDHEEVKRIGLILQQMNEERKKVERKIYESIENAIINNSINLAQEKVIIAGHREWPAGVIGLVAGKLMHAYGRPTLLFHLSSDGIAKGSCRSIPEFDMFNALTNCHDLLIKFGGHPAAAGLSLNEKNIGLLKERLEHLVEKQLSPDDLQAKINLDATLELADANKKLFDDMAYLEPFGNKNPQPIFLIKNVTLLNAPQLLKDRHVKCSFFSDGIIKPTIFFNRPDIYHVLSQAGDKSFHLAGQVIKNEWQGNTSIELQGLDIAVL